MLFRFHFQIFLKAQSGSEVFIEKEDRDSYERLVVDGAILPALSALGEKVSKKGKRLMESFHMHKGTV